MWLQSEPLHLPKRGTTFSTNSRRPGSAHLNETISPMTLEPAAISACPLCSVSHRISLFNFHSLQGCNYYFAFEETVAQKHQMTYPRSGSY